MKDSPTATVSTARVIVNPGVPAMTAIACCLCAESCASCLAAAGESSVILQTLPLLFMLKHLLKGEGGAAELEDGSLVKEPLESAGECSILAGEL